MRILKTLAAFVVAATLLGACGDNATVTPNNTPVYEVLPPMPDPNLTVTANCPITNDPMKDIPWIKSILWEYADGRYDGATLKVYRGYYKSKPVYFYEWYRSPTFHSAEAMDCKGRLLATYCRLPYLSKPDTATTPNLTWNYCNEDFYMPLKANSSQVTLVFEKK
jgi:hypothetical protein